MTRRLYAVLAVAISLFAAGCVGRGVGVRTSSGGDVVTMSPGQSIRSAMLSLRPGDTLLLRGGDYYENVDVTVRPATAAAGITMTHVSGERPIIHGRFWVRGPDYWTFDGINVTWPAHGLTSRDHLVGLINGVGWTWTNSEVWGARSFAGMLIAGTVGGEPANWTLSHSCVHDTYPSNNTNQDHNLYVNTGVTAGNGLISHNLFYNAPNGMGIKLGGSDVNTGGAAHVTVSRNTIYNSAQNLLVSWDSQNNRIFGNVFAKAGTDYANVRGYELVGANNTTYANAWWAGRGFLLNDTGYLGITDQGDETRANPRFDNTTSCTGFTITNPALEGFGR